MTALTTQLFATVDCSSERLRVCVEDQRQEVVARFQELDEAQQRRFVEEAWRVGFSAIASASAMAQEAKFADVGQALVVELQGRLEAHLKAQDERMQHALARFFDPNDGQVTERLKAFMDDQGFLAKQLQRFVGNDNSVLAQTLARQVGESSLLFKKLSPTESEGLVQVLERKIQQALESNRKELAAALNPLDENGTMGQFLGRLHKELEDAEEDRQEQLTRALRALDQNDETSLISRLLRENRKANETLRKAVDPRLPDSPLASVRKALEELLKTRLGTQEERLAKMHEEQQRFQADVRAAVERIDTRKVEEGRSAHGGTSFEHDVVAFLMRVVPSGVCTVTATGDTPDPETRRKVGDAVVRFTEESAFAGCGVVVEAKRDKSYRRENALEELSQAMKVRKAEIGLFVLAKCSAGLDFPPFARFGSRILVTWDPEDPISHGLLHGAVVAALALAQRRHAAADKGDIEALADVESRICTEIGRLASMQTWAGNISRDAAKISDEIRKSEKALQRVVEKAKKTLRALNVELREEQAEVQSPIEVGECPFEVDGAYDAAE